MTNHPEPEPAPSAPSKRARSLSGWRLLGWGFAVTLLILPAVAMQFTQEVQWDPQSFLFLGLLLVCVGVAIEFLVRQSPNIAYRAASLLTVAAAFLTVWVNLAVGMIGNEDNPHNLLFFALPALLLCGAMLVRFRAGAMARVLLTLALLQLAGGATGYAFDPQGGRFSMIFAGLWLLASALYWQAGRAKAATDQRT